MERAGKTIAKLKTMPGISAEELAFSAWNAAVGKRLAERAIPCALVRDRLIVTVEDAVWQKQLFHLRGAILAKLTEVMGVGLVNDLEFRIVKPSDRVERIPPRSAAALDSADSIADPVMREIYAGSKRRATKA
jgi:hypothetical protein